MLLDCAITTSDCLAACERYWWPKTINSDPAAHVELEFFDGDKLLPPPRPDAQKELKPFIDCYSNIQQGIKSEGFESKSINLSPGGVVGELCMTAIGDKAAKANDKANSVALIRSGLVIQYNHEYAREGDPTAIGVFEARGEKSKKIFTFSEPEAHDQWNQHNSRLSRALGAEAVSIVRRTHDRISESFRDFQTRLKVVVDKPSSEGLDFLNELLGPLFKKRKKGPPTPPISKRRAFSVQKRGWRDVDNDPTVDNLEFTISLMNDLGMKLVSCNVRPILKVLENADGIPGETIDCEVFDDDGGLVLNGKGSFSVELAEEVPLKFHASAPVHPSWRTKWTISVTRDDKSDSGGA